MAPPDRLVSCPIVVGRGRELDVVSQVLERLRDGVGHTVTLAGEAGIGKSRLVREALVLAQNHGLHVLQAACFELDRALPYAPILDLLRTPLAARIPERLAELRDPESRTVLAGFPDPSSDDPRQERRRLFDAFCQALARLAVSQPLVVVVEDLHWSDDASLECLGFAVRRLAAQPVVWLLTYRSDEAHPALAHLLAGFDRDRLASDLHLQRLTLDQVDAMLRAIAAPDRPSQEALRLIEELADGNPFFVEELARSLPRAGPLPSGSLSALAVPRSVGEAVRRRVQQTSQPAREALQLAAVAGRRFDFDVLRALLDCDEGDLLQRIRELIDAQLVVEESADRFAFRHALTRESVYSNLLARERRALHQRVAAVLAQFAAHGSDTRLEDLAYHFAQAGAWEDALEYSRRAGERAVGVHAPWAAVEHFTHALEAARQLQQRPAPALHRQRGLARETLGDFEGALADYEEALGLARAQADRHAEWHTLTDLALLWAGRSYESSEDYARRALALARDLDDPALVAHSLNRVGNVLVNVERVSESERHHEEALAIFQGLDDRRGIATTLDLLGLARLVGGDTVAAATAFEQVVASMDALGDRRGACIGLSMLTLCRGTSDMVVCAPASQVEATGAAERAVRIAREIGWPAGEAFSLNCLGTYLLGRGDYPRSLEAAQTALAIGVEIEHHQWSATAHSVLGRWYLDLLDTERARQHLEQGLALAREVGSEIWTRSCACFLALVHIEQGDLERAAILLRDVLPADAPARSISQRVIWLARAELVLARGDPATALRIAERLTAEAENLDGERVLPRLWKLRGDVLGRLGRAAEAEAVLRAARDAAAAQGVKPPLWRIHLALGSLWRAQARHAEAEGAYAAAVSVARALAASLPPDRAQAFVGRVEALAHPPSGPPAPGLGGLSERERQVAALVGRGYSNREIAQALVIAHRTAENHVAHILDKLGLTSRSQIAAWSATHGLLEDGAVPGVPPAES